MSDDRVSPEQWERYLGFAQAQGFAQMAAAPAGPVKVADLVTQWVADGMHGEMAWFEAGLERRLDPRNIIEGAQSVVVLTAVYEKEPCYLAGKKLARYACGTDYHDVLLKKLKRLCNYIREDFPRAEFRPYVDTGPMLERYWAQEAGLGWIGKNGNLMNRRYGSYLFLACFPTNLIMPYGSRGAEHCGSCRRCIDACPTQAIVAPGKVDSRRCISYLTIEHRGPFPEETPDFENWIFGCDICQEVCPWTQKFAEEPQIPQLKPRDWYQEVTAESITEMEAADFQLTFRKSPIKRTKREGLVRNLEHLTAREN